MLKQLIFKGAARHVLTALGGFVVAKGWADADLVNQVSGVVIGLLGLGLSATDKVEQNKHTVVLDKPVVNTRVLSHPAAAVTPVSQGFTLSERSRKNLQGVDPLLVKVVETAIQISSMDFGVTEGLRTEARQQQLRSEGKSWVKRSRHQDGLAVDVIAYPTPQGSWEPRDYYPINDAMQEAAMRCGARITWGGTWKQGDFVHFQLDGEIA